LNINIYIYLQEQLDAENAAAKKPKAPEMLAKIMEGKLRKRLADVCLRYGFDLNGAS